MYPCCIHICDIGKNMRSTNKITNFTHESWVKKVNTCSSMYTHAYVYLLIVHTHLG